MARNFRPIVCLNLLLVEALKWYFLRYDLQASADKHLYYQTSRKVTEKDLLAHQRSTSAVKLLKAWHGLILKQLTAWFLIPGFSSGLNEE